MDTANIRISMIEILNEKSAPLYLGFRKLHEEIFGEKYTRDLEEEMDRRQNCKLLVSHSDTSEVLGFKLGYETGVTEFYSWTGGVLPSARKRGIASSLMKAQHDWCREHGYKRIQTKTKNKWREMLILNIKSGF